MTKAKSKVHSKVSSKTKLKTQSISNVKLLVGIGALFMGGLAFLAAPSLNFPSPSPNLCGVKKITLVNPLACQVGKVSGADILCHDGLKMNFRPGACFAPEFVTAKADQLCENRCTIPTGDINLGSPALGAGNGAPLVVGGASVACSDSDVNTLNPFFINGTTIGNLDHTLGGTTTTIDYCTQNVLNEFSCEHVANVAYPDIVVRTTHDCAVDGRVCRNGACVRP